MGLLDRISNAFKSTEAKGKKDYEKVKSVIIYYGDQTAGRGSFLTPPVNFDEIHSAYMTDSYIRQAIDKYSDLVFKSGWKYVSKNDNAIEYLKQRLNYMAFQTDITFDQLLSEISSDLVKYSNAFLIKARVDKSYVKTKATPINGNSKIVGGYFRVNPRKMSVELDDKGNITKWKLTGNGDEQEFKPEDVIHFYYKKEAGEVYGIPFYYQSLEDVRLLRAIEDDVAKLVHRYSAPLYHVSVGLAQPGYEGTEEDINLVRSLIEQASGDGVLITNEKVDVKISGAEGSAINAENYLKYFENRVFTGLGVSATQMGRGDTANSSTADSLDQQMLNKIKAFQKTIENTVTYKVFSELLLEGGFDVINDIEQIVKFEFNEINLDTEIKLQNHKVFMFEHDAITYDELRDELGYDEADESRIRSNMFGATNNNDTNNREQPENQHGKNDAPKIKPMSNSISTYLYHALNYMDNKSKESLINEIKKSYCLENDNGIDALLMQEIDDILARKKNGQNISTAIEALRIDKLVTNYVNKMQKQ